MRSAVFTMASWVLARVEVTSVARVEVTSVARVEVTSVARVVVTSVARVEVTSVARVVVSAGMTAGLADFTLILGFTAITIAYISRFSIKLYQNLDEWRDPSSSSLLIPFS